MNITVKQLYQLQIAMKLDDYLYEKDTQGYFESKPHIGLVDSQVDFINGYLYVLENKNDLTYEEFKKLVRVIKSDNDKYKELLRKGSKSKKVKKYSRITGYLLRQLSKYDKMF